MVEVTINDMKLDIELIKLAIKLEEDCEKRQLLKEELEMAKENLQNTNIQ